MDSPDVVLLFRLLRIASVVFGLVFIDSILVGAFKYMVASGADDRVARCRYLIFVGTAGVILMIMLFLFSTSVLLRLD